MTDLRTAGLLPLIVFILLVGGAFVTRDSLFRDKKVEAHDAAEEQVLGEQSEEVQKSEVSTTVTVDNEVVASSTTTSTPTPAPTATQEPTIKPTPQSNGALSDWSYPGATIASSSDKSLELRSGDNPDQITNWYKDKVRNSGMNVKNFVTTTTNGQVLNKLAGSSSSLTVHIDITKKACLIQQYCY